MDLARNWLSRTSSLNPHIILADEQTQGRGRHERYWHSLKGNLFVSIVMPVSKPITEISQVSFIAAIALGQSIEAIYNISSYSYKWPNDVMVDHKKTSGILLEAEVQAEQPWIILGLGVNLINSPGDKVSYMTTSLLQESGIVALPMDFLSVFFTSFQKLLLRWQEEGFAFIRELWLKNAEGLNKKMKTMQRQNLIEGIFCDIDDKGALLLQLENKEILRVVAGKIF
jgi:BirA family biotin operon repressor/biotin-[acetyl-CoA-carboxylase] ligase